MRIGRQAAQIIDEPTKKPRAIKIDMYHIRKELGYSIKMVAQAIGVSPTTITHIESNTYHRVSRHIEDALCAFYGKTKEELWRIQCGPQIFPCKKYKLPKDEIERMLAAEFGKKLRPITR